MSLVEYYYTRIYDSDADRYIKRVLDTLKDLFLIYRGGVVASSTNDTTVGSSPIPRTCNEYEDYERWFDERNGIANQKSEWESYLEEKRYPKVENFSILNWWKMNSPRFPILAKIARDLLAVPATTVASEAAFSVGGRVIDESRASLSPDVVEALIVADDWIIMESDPNTISSSTQSFGSEAESIQRL